MSVPYSPIFPCVDLVLLYSMEHYRLHHHCYTSHHYRYCDAAVNTSHYQWLVLRLRTTLQLNFGFILYL